MWAALVPVWITDVIRDAGWYGWDSTLVKAFDVPCLGFAVGGFVFFLLWAVER